MFNMFKYHKKEDNLILFLAFLLLMFLITTTLTQVLNAVNFLQQPPRLLENKPSVFVSTATITQHHDGDYYYVKYV